MTGFSLSGRRIYVAGHQGMVGQALVRRLGLEKAHLVLAPRGALDLRRQQPVEDFLARERPDVVILAAARVGGILANDQRPGEFIGDNLAIQTNLIEACRQLGVARFLFLGSSCIYPKLAHQPMAEDALLTGPLEPTNEWYAVAKIAGLKMVEAYRRQWGFPGFSLMPTNLYGPGDNFDLASSHVLPALIAKAHRARESGAKTLEVWGSGTPRREFLFVDDLADAAIHLLKTHDGGGFFNVGTGEDIAIADLARMVARITGFDGEIVFDRSKPDGTPRKLLDVAKLHATGWHHRTSLEDGIAATCRWYLDQRAGGKATA